MGTILGGTEIKAQASPSELGGRAEAPAWRGCPPRHRQASKGGRSDLSAGPKDTVVLASPDQDMASKIRMGPKVLSRKNIMALTY